MPSASFVRAKEKGRYFEELMVPVLIEMGFTVIDTDHWKYSQKKGVDKIVEINGARCGLEFKYDRMSEQTGNCCIDLDSINKTTSAIWIYGLPNGSRIDVYSMRISDLAPFAQAWPIKRKVGENGWVEAALIPKQTFINQPFVHHWKTINK